ncbi:hypothetical protein [Flectobacillus major]|uniref:hypothetical protein n=1 Tax=Flectobacillus major TaxID=103 RepID=UPI0011837AB8|nr:hypothetical protein [Flectobacillus major]
MSKKISLSQALAMICNPNQTHSIKYRKSSAGQVGVAGSKDGVTVRTVKGENFNMLSASKKFGADGLLKLWQPRTQEQFDIVIDLLTHIDGMEIEHPYN